MATGGGWRFGEQRFLVSLNDDPDNMRNEIFEYKNMKPTNNETLKISNSSLST